MFNAISHQEINHMETSLFIEENGLKTLTVHNIDKDESTDIVFRMVS